MCADVAAEIRNSYVDTMGKAYAHDFKEYLASLKKLQKDYVINKTDVLANDETEGTSVTSM